MSAQHLLSFIRKHILGIFSDWARSQYKMQNENTKVARNEAMKESNYLRNEFGPIQRDRFSATDTARPIQRNRFSAHPFSVRKSARNITAIAHSQMSAQDLGISAPQYQIQGTRFVSSVSEMTLIKFKASRGKDAFCLEGYSHHQDNRSRDGEQIFRRCSNPNWCVRMERNGIEDIPWPRYVFVFCRSRTTCAEQGRAQELAEGGLRQISNGTPIKNIPRHRTASGFTLPHSLGGSASSQANQPL